MRNIFLAGILLAALSVHGKQLLTPQYDSNTALAAHEYLTESITLQLDAELNEGILAYANQVAHGDKVTAVSSSGGFAIYAMLDGQYKLIQEVTNAELGLDNYSQINQLHISATDNWLLILVNNSVITVPLDQQYQPLLASRKQVNIGYVNQMQLSGAYAVVNSGYSVNTYAVDPNTGNLTALETIQLQNYAERIALSMNVLLIGQSSWSTGQENLAVYQRTNNQWQKAGSHSMSYNSSYQPVRYLAVSPNGQRIVYGGNNVSYLLHFDPLSSQLNELASGNNLFNTTFSSVNFADENTVLLKNGDELFVHNTSTMQQLAKLNLRTTSSNTRDMKVRQQKVTVLSDSGLMQLDANTLSVNTSLFAGEQDIALGFNEPANLMALGDDYLLQRANSVFRLYKLNKHGMPELTQTSTPMQLLGHNEYYTITSRDIGNNQFVLFQANRYALLKLDAESGQLQRISSGTLTDRNNQQMYLSAPQLVNIGSNLVVASNDSLTLFKLQQNNQFTFADAVVNGASGVTGIGQIQMLIASGDNIYTVNQQNQTISHFVINENRLQQKQLYQGYAIPPVDSYLLNNNLLTLQSSNYLQSYHVADNGKLTFLSNQYLPAYYSQWVRLGKRFAAVKDWDGLHILEQNNISGVWNNSLSINNQQLEQDYQLTQSVLLPLAGNLAIYDQSKRRLISFSHNSAPYVADAALLQQNLHQGQTYQVNLNTMLRDDEDSSLTFSLQHAAEGISISNDGVLSINGKQNASGSFDLLAADSIGLVSRASFNYQLNLAPITKVTPPVFTSMQGESIQIELAQYFTDPEGQALSFTLVSAPAGLTLSNTGLITGVVDTAGEQNLSFIVADSAGAIASHSVQLTVTAKPSRSGGSMHWLWLSLFGALALYRQRAGSRI